MYYNFNEYMFFFFSKQFSWGYKIDSKSNVYIDMCDYNLCDF